MSKRTRQELEALAYHAKPSPGKIQVVPTKKYATQRDLSLAYSPGVAAPCLEIQKNPSDAYKYTSKVMIENMLKEDAKEGIDAFINKRNPQWTDK